jgi:prevent-host-death family protein
MPEIGVRELKTHASEIIRRVREQRMRYIITYRGRPVGLLIPLEQPPKSVTQEDAWEELVRLGALIGLSASGQTATDLLLEMRNEGVDA